VAGGGFYSHQRDNWYRLVNGHSPVGRRICLAGLKNLAEFTP
jgi:hypothetical protein